MAWAYASPAVNSAHAGVGAVIGAGAGVAQGLGTAWADSQGLLGAPVVPQIGTNGQLVNYITGIAAGGLGVAGVLGKGPLRTKPAVATSVLTYGGSVVTTSVVARVANLNGTNPSVVSAVVSAKSALAARGYGNTVTAFPNRAGVASAKAVTPLTSSQRAASRLS